MSTGVSCLVYVDGIRAADGCTNDAPDAPVILEDLTVAWGRSDTMTQPGADTCTFSVMDPLGGSAFTDVFRVGRRVDVKAEGASYPDPSIPTFVNPGFETAAITWAATGGTASRTGARFATGANSLRLAPTVAGQAATLWLAPGAFVPAGTNPAAWDAIPQTAEGQTWEATISLWLPLGSSATVRQALFSGPYADAGVAAGAPEKRDGNGTWQTFTVTSTVQTSGKWLGFNIVFSPTGLAWNDVDAALTWNTYDAALSWDDTGSLYVDNAQIKSPAAGAGRTVLVFTGRITDMSAQWDNGAGCPIINVACAGFTADLDNRNIGDTPWAVETVAARANRILTLSGLPITIDIDTSIDEVLLSWVDVDSQGAAGLLSEIAVSVDGVLWPAVHQSLGAYFRLEDPALRTALLKFAEVNGKIVIVAADPESGWNLSACVILRDPVTWVQDVSDVATRASVTWKVQGVDDKGLPTTTDATEYVIDTARETLYGTRNVSVSTQLQSAADAQGVAQRILSRATPAGWRVGGLAIDDDDVTGDPTGIATVLDLLDGTSRIGAPLVIGDLPAWSPAGSASGAYLEGGTYRFVGGRWVLELGVSVATGLGTSASWDEMKPSWAWDSWDPGITWNDLRGVSA